MDLDIDIPSSVSESQVDRGIEIFNAFYIAAKKFKNFDLSFEDLVKYYGSKAPFLLEGLADAADNVGITDVKAKEYMKRFAGDIKGKIPKDWLSYQLSYSKYAVNPSWFATLSYVTSQTAKTVVKGLEEHGQQLITTLKLYNTILPVAILGGIGYFLYQKVLK